MVCPAPCPMCVTPTWTDSSSQRAQTWETPIEAGMNMDLRIVKGENASTVGSSLRHFLPNWGKVTQSQWVLDAVSGYLTSLKTSQGPSYATHGQPEWIGPGHQN